MKFGSKYLKKKLIIVLFNYNILTCDRDSRYFWWVAKIGETKNSLVYYPFPHFPGYQPDIYYKNWTKVDHMYSDKWSQDSKPYLL